MTQPQSAPSTVREYEVRARSTDTFGRVLCSARTHHFIVDGPVQNGCPGEELTPPELFLSAVASCGIELVHVIAKETSTPIDRVAVKVWGQVDRGRQPRQDITLFTSVRLDFELFGTDSESATNLVNAFKRR
jgi:uncharacterized OsmC-like protein